jgi:hypothetical protein
VGDFEYKPIRQILNRRGVVSRAWLSTFGLRAMPDELQIFSACKYYVISPRPPDGADLMPAAKPGFFWAVSLVPKMLYT